MNTRKLTLLAMYLTIALTIFVAESTIPPLLPLPGIKLGLANIITLWVLLSGDVKDALCVLLLRIILGSIFTGQVTSFFYSLAGGLFSLLVMTILYRFFGKKHLVLISVSGAIFHNLGQLLAAFVILQSFSVFTYLPILMVSGIVTGTFTGLCTQLVYDRIKKSGKHT